MSSKTVRTKVESYLQANWVDTVIAGEENDISSPPANLDPWLSYGFKPFGEEVKSIGSPGAMCYEERGLIYFNVWVASGRSTATALTHAESIRNLMRYQDLGNGVRLLVAAPPDVGIPSQTNSSAGNWFAYQVVVDYRYNYVI